MILDEITDFAQAIAPMQAIAGLDFGEKTVGVAVSDTFLTVATPLETIRRRKFTLDADALAAKCTHAGAIFLGAWTPEAIGDYIGGPNHVLPTARSARFSSGLSVMDFVKRTTLARMTPEALNAIGPSAERLAQSESLEAHGLSVRARLDRLNQG